MPFLKPLAKAEFYRYFCLMLNHIIFDTPSDRPTLLIVHGLYGSARNWGVIAKRLSESRRVITVDQRNHGESPWYDSHTYFDMADDLENVIRAQGAPMDVVGHSMGGKAAMILALQHPELVNRLIVADIAPVAYAHDQRQYIQAMKAVDLTKIEKRSEASAELSKTVPDATLQSFFTQSLDLQAKRWRLNLDVLERDMHHIVGFPEISGTFEKPTLFLTGAQSHYVTHEHRPRIKDLFPNAKFAKIPNVGHWLHAEAPRPFEETVRMFFN